VGHDAISRRAVERVDAGRGDREADHDDVVIEAPLEIRAGGEPLAVVLRTPGHDLELVRGLLYAEGVLAAGDGDAVVAPADGSGDAVDLALDRGEIDRRWPRRALAMNSACGACGKPSIAALETRAAAVASELVVPAALVAALPDRLRAAQPVFAATGGLHGAALFAADGALLAAREDVGRHNAVDKLVGWAMAAGRLPLGEAVLCVSGRLGFEIAQKAVVAGVPVVVAVSAPSSLAVDLGERFRLALCGFARGGRLNIYSHGWRVGV
jgi:FdhD protein